MAAWAAARPGGRVVLRRVAPGADLPGLCRATAEQDYAVLVAAGGDGTIGAVAELVAGTDTRMGVLPLGTFNYFARAQGIPLDNESLRLDHGGPFWLADTDSASALKAPGRPGLHDPAAAFAAVPPGAPAILPAHEPDPFAEGPPALLRIGGHTHGGKADLFGWRPLTPSAHGARFARGHVAKGGRHLIIPGGFGYTGVPLRRFQPPEISLVTLTGAD